MPTRTSYPLALLEKILEGQAEPQAVIDEDFRLLLSNQVWKRQFGQTLPAPGSMRLTELGQGLRLAVCSCAPAQMPGYVLSLDRDGLIQFCSPIAPGYVRDEVLGRPATDYLEASYHDRFVADLEAVYRGETVCFEVEGAGPGGTRARYLGTIGPVMREGQVVLANLLAVDVTELRETGQRLNLFEQIYHNSNDAIAVVDLAGVYIIQNRAHAELLGYSDRELEGQTPAIHLGQEAFSQIATELATHGNCRTTAISRAKDGKTMPLELSAFTVFDRDNKPVCFVGIKRDMSEHKAIEAELARARDAALHSARQKSEFLRNMSHEIRTPMNGVIAMTELLLETGLDEEQYRLADTVHSSAASLLTILDDILDFSKIEAGLLSFQSIEFDLGQTVDAVLALLRGQALARELELTGHLAADVPRKVVGDPGRLRQVLTNLIGNALKFTRQGSVRVEVSRQGNRLCFEVIDTGPGISREDQAQLFSPFFQTSEGQRAGGTGLGLAISRQLVRLMGGELEVESEPGRGSTFRFTARLETREASRTSSTAPILVIEDNTAQRDILLQKLRHLGWEAEGAADLDPERLTPEVKLVLLDRSLPGRDGLEVCHELGEQRGHRSWILLLPAGQPAPEPRELARAGLIDCLSKPVDEEALVSSLERLGLPGAKLPPDLRVLVVEDNAMNSAVIQRQLERLGLQPELARHGQEALAKEGPFDIVLMDCEMPQMDGYEASAELRRRLGDSGPVIIAMTAHALQGDRERCLEAGMDDYLSKPVKTEALREMLERWTFKREPGPPPRSASQAG